LSGAQMLISFQSIADADFAVKRGIGGRRGLLPCLGDACLADEIDYFLCGRAGAEERIHPCGEEFIPVFFRYDASTGENDAVCAARAEQLSHFSENGHVRAGKHRETHDVDVFLYRRFDDHLRCLMEAGINNLHSGVSQGPRDDYRASVVAVKAGLGDEHSYLLFGSHGNLREAHF